MAQAVLFPSSAGPSMRSLEPIILKEKYYSEIEGAIRLILEEILYRPLLDIVGTSMRTLHRNISKRPITQRGAAGELRNSMGVLLSAIANGDIWYEDGQFKGRFNARTSAAIIKLGGKFNVRAKTYSLPRGKLPEDIKLAQARANDQYAKMRSQMLSTLDNIQIDKLQLSERIRAEYEKTIARMEADLQKTLPKGPVAKADNPASAISQLIIEAKLTPDQKRIIAQDWGNNLELYIKGWAQENILKLREDIQPHILAGGRAQGLVKAIQDNYGVGVRKAKFLARQETALLMSKFQETRYRDMGISKYRWSSAHDARVRHDHQELNGEIFRFDSPPITDKKTGARNNPGEDFNCRCVAIPVFD